MTRSPDLDPRQLDCWQRYIDPTSETFANAKRSALAAGYSEAHSQDVKAFDWFKRMEQRSKMNKMRVKAERVLDEMLDLPVLVRAYEGQGEEKKEIVVTDTTLVKIKQDTAKFTVERLGKDEWSTRSEHTGAEGGPIVTKDLRENGNSAIDQFLGKTPGNPEIEGSGQA